MDLTKHEGNGNDILGDPGAARRVQGIFVGGSLSLKFRPKKSPLPD